MAHDDSSDKRDGVHEAVPDLLSLAVATAHALRDDLPVGDIELHIGLDGTSVSARLAYPGEQGWSPAAALHLGAARALVCSNCGSLVDPVAAFRPPAFDAIYHPWSEDDRLPCGPVEPQHYDGGTPVDQGGQS